MPTDEFINAARGLTPCDLLLSNARIVDVFSIDPYPHIVGQPYSYQGFAVDAAYKAVGM